MIFSATFSSNNSPILPLLSCFSFVATGASRAGHLRHPNPMQEIRQSYLAGTDLGEDGAFRFVQAQNPFVRRLLNCLRRATRGGPPPVLPFHLQRFLGSAIDSPIYYTNIIQPLLIVTGYSSTSNMALNFPNHQMKGLARSS